MVWTIVRIIGRTGARSRSGAPGTPAPADPFQNQAEKLSEEDRKGLVAYLLHCLSGLPSGPDDAEVEKREAEMDSGLVTPSATPNFLSQKVNAPRWHKEGRFAQIFESSQLGYLRSGSESPMPMW